MSTAAVVSEQPTNLAPSELSDPFRAGHLSHDPFLANPASEDGRDDIIIGQPPLYEYTYEGLVPKDEEEAQTLFIIQQREAEEEEKTEVRQSEPEWNNTHQAKVADLIFVSQEQKPSSEENVKMLHSGLDVVNKMFKIKPPPLKECMQKFDRFKTHFIFFANLCVSIADVILAPEHLHYKMTALAFGVFENGMLFIIWFATKMVEVDSDKKKRWSDKYGFLGRYAANIRNFLVNYTQHFENILHELLIYPMIIIIVVGVATEKSYQFESQELLTSIAMGLICVDILELLFTYIVRAHMVRKFVRDLKNDVPSIRNIRIGSIHVVSAFYWNLFWNTIMFGVMLVMMYLQIMHENSESQDYTVNANSIVMIVCALILPLFNIIMFVLVNYFIVLEILMKINVRFAKNTKFREKLESKDEYIEKHGAAVVKAMEFARKKVVTNTERLNLIQRMPVRKKLLYGLSEWWIVLCLLLWCGVYTGYFMCFTLEPHPMYGEIIQYIYMGIIVIGNPQLFMLVEIVDLFIISYLLMGLHGFVKSFGKFHRARKDEANADTPICTICFDSFCKESCYCFGIMDDDKSQNKFRSGCCRKKQEDDEDLQEGNEDAHADVPNERQLYGDTQQPPQAPGAPVTYNRPPPPGPPVAYNRPPPPGASWHNNLPPRGAPMQMQSNQQNFTSNMQTNNIQSSSSTTTMFMK